MLVKCVFVCLLALAAGCRSKADKKAPVVTTTEASSTQAIVSSSKASPIVTTPSPNPTPPDGPQDHPPVTVTPSGTIRGSWMTTRRGRRFQAYRGIRYAQPPVGELRFQPPKPILQYPGEVDASQEGPACPLPVSPEYYVDEDCLTINVYTPDNKSTKPLPVIFFIHPGGFYSMTGRSDVVGPHYLLDRDVVLVSINYRLGSLGFLSTGDALAPGNNGFKDQVMALRWVQRNIRSFGGDPDLVTVSGCSAGSISVMLLMISPMAKGLFHRGISMSGSPVGKAPLLDNMYDLAVKQARLLNCPTNSSEVIISCLKTKSWREIGNSLGGFFDEFGDPIGVWSPIVERDFGQERFLHIDPTEAILQGKMHAVPHLISQTTNEFFWKAFSVVKNETLRNRMNADWERVAAVSFQLPETNLSTAAATLRRAYLRDKPIVDDADSARLLGKLYGHAVIGFNVHRMAFLMSLHSPHKVWYAEFAHIGNHSFYEDPTTKKPTGAAHHDDLIYLFTMSFQFPVIEAGDSIDSKIVDRMTAIWYNFARYGDPNPRGTELPELQGLQWPKMTPDKREYLRIGEEFSVRNKMFENYYEVWEDIYRIEY